MLEGSRPGPAWLWLPFLSSQGIGYGSSLPPTGAGMTLVRADAAVVQRTNGSRPIDPAMRPAVRSKFLRSIRQASRSFCMSHLGGVIYAPVGTETIRAADYSLAVNI